MADADDKVRAAGELIIDYLDEKATSPSGSNSFTTKTSTLRHRAFAGALELVQNSTRPASRT